MKKKVRENLMKMKVSYQEAESILQQRIDLGKKMLQSSINSLNSLKLAEKRYNIWNSENFEILKKIFCHPNIALDYTATQWSISSILISDYNLTNRINKIKSNIETKLQKLESIKSSIEWEIQDNIVNSRIFFVHGTDCANSAMVLNFIRSLNITPIIMHDLAAAGKTIVEEIQNRNDVHYAVCLLTPDELGGKDAENMNFRADQKVILELGIFIGLLGRENVSNLYIESVELPQDYHEFQHIRIDDSENWKDKLIEELKTAGLKMTVS
jgi:predicted nucleotide-binding protein